MNIISSPHSLLLRLHWWCLFLCVIGGVEVVGSEESGGIKEKSFSHSTKIYPRYDRPTRSKRSIPADHALTVNFVGPRGENVTLDLSLNNNGDSPFQKIQVNGPHKEAFGSPIKYKGPTEGRHHHCLGQPRAEVCKELLCKDPHQAGTVH
uniref:Uncharacterized protein n=1 Tax=Lepeophtheirus salmonis TaxID=72036 RepID=A0A0K2T520_LEPSM